MNAYLVGTLTIALISTGIALVILKRFNPVQRVLVSVACGYTIVTFAAEPVTKQIGIYEVYDSLWFFTFAVIYSCVFFHSFTKHGFVLGWVFKNTVPLLRPINGSTPISDQPLSVNGRTIVELNTAGAKTIWEM